MKHQRHDSGSQRTQEIVLYKKRHGVIFFSLAIAVFLSVSVYGGVMSFVKFAADFIKIELWPSLPGLNLDWPWPVLIFLGGALAFSFFSVQRKTILIYNRHVVLANIAKQYKQMSREQVRDLDITPIMYGKHLRQRLYVWATKKRVTVQQYELTGGPLSELLRTLGASYSEEVIEKFQNVSWWKLSAYKAT